jgi:hypothetical protein
MAQYLYAGLISRLQSAANLMGDCPIVDKATADELALLLREAQVVIEALEEQLVEAGEAANYDDRV